MLETPVSPCCVETTPVSTVFTDVEPPPLVELTQVVAAVVEVEGEVLIAIEDIDGPRGLLLQAEKMAPKATATHKLIAIFFIFFTSPYNLDL